MMMMMMMMRRFVKRILNSPQRRCQSIKQVALEMSGERQRRQHCGSKGSWQTVPDAWAIVCGLDTPAKMLSKRSQLTE